MKTTKCKQCGSEFEQSKSNHFIYCQTCREKRKKESLIKASKKQYDKIRVRNKWDKTEKQKKSDSSVEKWHREILEYERKYGKRISYGELQKLKRLGKF